MRMVLEPASEKRRTERIVARSYHAKAPDRRETARPLTCGDRLRLAMQPALPRSSSRSGPCNGSFTWPRPIRTSC